MSLYFVAPNSVVRQIWGRSDTILLIFAGAAAEFALNKAVDWLYFTGRLPADPLGRLFSTVGYARAIVFSEQAGALRAIEHMSQIHAGVEASRGYAIPPEAYRDVLFMLTDYSMRAFELLERPLTLAEQEEVFRVFNRLGQAMGLTGLPDSLAAWRQARAGHLMANLHRSAFTDDLFLQYRKHLGPWRYALLRQAQASLAPTHVRTLLGLPARPWLPVLVAPYRLAQRWRLDRWVKVLLFPKKYQAQIWALDQ